MSNPLSEEDVALEAGGEAQDADPQDPDEEAPKPNASVASRNLRRVKQQECYKLANDSLWTVTQSPLRGR